MRKCGYCRDIGHTSANCQQKKVQIETVQRQYGRQRTMIADALTRSGYGIGAVISAYDYFNGKMVNCIVTQESLDAAMTVQTFNEFRIVKYSKQVRACMIEYFNDRHNELDGLVQYTMREAFYLPVQSMDIGASPTVNAYIHVSDFVGFVDMDNKYAIPERKGNSAWNRYSQILLPSNDGRPSSVAMNTPFFLHERLSKARIPVPPLFT